MGYNESGEYGASFEDGQEGFLVDGGPRQIDSCSAEGTVTAAKAVIFGTADKRVKPWAASSKVAGVALARTVHEGNILSIKDKESVSLLKKGKVWVKVAEAVTHGDLAYFGASGWTKTSASNDLVGKYITIAAANGLAQLEVNLP